MNIASLIDHTILRPDCTIQDVERIAAEAKEYQFASVCIPPFFVKDTGKFLEESQVKISTVIGFPMGYAATSAKVEEIKRALDEGADELDVVINLCAVKNGNWNYVKNDIDSMTRAVHLKGKVIKVIIETALLTEQEMVRLCEIGQESGVNFIKTSTGFNGPGANPDIVRFLRSHLSSNIQIKASGGIRTKEDAISMVQAGASRIGTSSGIAIVNSGY